MRPPPSAPVARLPALRGGDAVGPPRRPRRSCPRAPRRLASSTSTPRVRVRTSRRRWPVTSGIERCSSGRTPAPRSTRAAPTTSRSSSPTFRGCSRCGALPLDVVLVNATPPDAHGFCSLGTCVEAMHAAIRAAKTVIVQLNRAMPRTLGESFIHVDEIDLGVEVDVPPYEHASRVHRAPWSAGSASTSPTWCPDGATLQLGIGAHPGRRLPWRCGTSATSGSTPRCSPMRWSTSSKPA